MIFRIEFYLNLRNESGGECLVLKSILLYLQAYSRTRESVSRVLTEFDKDGIINISGKKVEITNQKSLSLISANG